MADRNHRWVTVNITGRELHQISVRASPGAGRGSVEVPALPVRTEPVPIYEGQYTVEPYFTAQVLPTDGKKLTRDLTVNPIYTAETSNPAGGITFYIGGEFIG